MKKHVGRIPDLVDIQTRQPFKTSEREVGLDAEFSISNRLATIDEKFDTG